jgi:hypothetical protein
MSPETVQLLISGDAVVGYLFGLIGLILIALATRMRDRPIPVAGLAIAGAGIVAIHRTYTTPAGLVVGVALLALAGLIPVRSDVASMVLSLPGAAALGYTFVESGRPELIVLVVTGTTLLGPLAARFDVSHPRGLGTSMMVVAYGATLVLVPDTDWVIIATAAAIPIIVAGYPLGLARLGRAGAIAATGLLIWLMAGGGVARPATVLAGLGVLGLLIVDPIVRRSSGVDTGRREPIPAIGVQVVVGLALAVLAANLSQPVVVAVITAAVLAAAGAWSAGSVSHR